MQSEDSEIRDLDQSPAGACRSRHGDARVKRLAALLLLAALVGAGAFLWPRVEHAPADVAAAGQPAQSPAVAVGVATVVAKPVPVEFGTIGTVTAYATVAVKSRIDGEIMEVHLKDGQEVKAGDLLFSIDNRTIRTQLEQAQANLARDQALLAQRAAGSGAPDLAGEEELRQQAGGGPGEGERQFAVRRRCRPTRPPSMPPMSSSATRRSALPSTAAPASSTCRAATW